MKRTIAVEILIAVACIACLLPFYLYGWWWSRSVTADWVRAEETAAAIKTHEPLINHYWAKAYHSLPPESDELLARYVEERELVSRLKHDKVTQEQSVVKEKVRIQHYVGVVDWVMYAVLIALYPVRILVAGSRWALRTLKTTS